jgi:hypothetical protein
MCKNMPSVMMQMTQAIADAGVVAEALDEVVARAKEEGFQANDLGWGELGFVSISPA